MKNGFRLTTRLPAAPAAVYAAWLSGRAHGAMTGAAATGTARVGARHTAWDGYIRGRNLKLEPNTLIVQSWRTTEFSDSDPDSRVELRIRPHRIGCELVLVHTDIPRGQAADYRNGWVEHYFTPMKKYFLARSVEDRAARKSARRKIKRRRPAARNARRKR